MNKLSTTIVFADISRAFDRLSHRGLYAKLDLFGFSTAIKDWFYSFLTGRRQRTNVNGVFSHWSFTKAGVPQGSVLGPLIFLLMINDLPTKLTNDVRLFADDTSILITHSPTIDPTDTINDDVNKLMTWADSWLIDLNPTKTKCMSISYSNSFTIPSPSFRGTPIDIVSHHKHLGLILNDKMTWTDHIEYLTDKVARRIGILRSLKYKLSRSCLRTVYVTHIRSILEYCDVIWDSCTSTQQQGIEKLQRESIRIITGLPMFCCSENLYHESGFNTLAERRRQHRLTLFYKSIILGQCPIYFREIFPDFIRDTSTRNDRRLNTFCHFPVTRNLTFLRSFLPNTIIEWNDLPLGTRIAPSISIFKRLLRSPITDIPILLELPRHPSIIYTRIKCRSSSLNAHLFKCNLVPSPLCACHTGVEDTFHYMFNCPHYDTQREILMLNLDEIGLVNFPIEVLFDCETHLNAEIIHRVQAAVFKYIVSTHRF